LIRLLLVDDQMLVRAGLRMLCESVADFEIVGEAENGQQAIRLAERLLPDVILMDLRMPGMDGIAATGRILAARPLAKIVVLTTFDDDDHLYPALAAGACGFLVKDAAPEELLDGIRRAACGDSPFSAAVLRRVVDQAVRAHSCDGPDQRPGSLANPDQQAELLVGLTQREREVLALLGSGLSNAEIAARLHVGVTTVKTHVSSLIAKTGTANRIGLAVLATRAGVLPG
jgi:DNA-binding NarL/FixJ family response regulator